MSVYSIHFTIAIELFKVITLVWKYSFYSRVFWFLLYLYTVLVCLFVRLYPINAKTAQIIEPKICEGRFKTSRSLKICEFFRNVPKFHNRVSEISGLGVRQSLPSVLWWSFCRYHLILVNRILKILRSL